MSIYSLKGSLIAVLMNDKKSAGIYELDVNNAVGRPLASGLYFCQLETKKGHSAVKYTVR